jgi:hypothetical protein
LAVGFLIKWPTVLTIFAERWNLSIGLCIVHSFSDSYKMVGRSLLNLKDGLYIFFSYAKSKYNNNSLATWGLEFSSTTQLPRIYLALAFSSTSKQPMRFDNVKLLSLRLSLTVYSSYLLSHPLYQTLLREKYSLKCKIFFSTICTIC